MDKTSFKLAFFSVLLYVTASCNRGRKTEARQVVSFRCVNSIECIFMFPECMNQVCENHICRCLDDGPSVTITGYEPDSYRHISVTVQPEPDSDPDTHFLLAETESKSEPDKH
ncbi:hypothetical protein O6P43_025975 [Quillaja saponaria]|uniref:Uncharacterized protein n=1 Tax=Quillaja saponaria TaxID=32244 RepID=A0AAD7PGT2_QUISA|nr:hypothetical protein O6P43_025975 [Quillaja saponaria]